MILRQNQFVIKLFTKGLIFDIVITVYCFSLSLNQPQQGLTKVFKKSSKSVEFHVPKLVRTLSPSSPVFIFSIKRCCIHPVIFFVTEEGNRGRYTRKRNAKEKARETQITHNTAIIMDKLGKELLLWITVFFQLPSRHK